MRLNKTINKVNDSLFAKEKLWSKLMAFAVSSGDYSKLKKVRKELIYYVDSSKTKVINLKDTAGSENFRKCELEFLGLEKRIISEDFTVFEKLRYNSPMNKVSLYIEKIKTDGKIEQLLLIKLKNVQDTFEQKNGFKFSKSKSTE